MVGHWAGHLEDFRHNYLPCEEVVEVAVEAQTAKAAALCDVGPSMRTPVELMAVVSDYMRLDVNIRQSRSAADGAFYSRVLGSYSDFGWMALGAKIGDEMSARLIYEQVFQWHMLTGSGGFKAC